MFFSATVSVKSNNSKNIQERKDFIKHQQWGFPAEIVNCFQILTSFPKIHLDVLQGSKYAININGLFESFDKKSRQARNKKALTSIKKVKLTDFV